MQTFLEKQPRHIVAASIIASSLLSATPDHNLITFDDTNKIEIRKTYEISTRIDKEKKFSTEYNIIQEKLLSYVDEVASPSPTAMYYARKMLVDLSDKNIIVPKIMLDNEREISFFWRGENEYIELSINEHGLFSYLIDDKIKPIGGEDISIIDLKEHSLFLNLQLMQSTKS